MYSFEEVARAIPEMYDLAETIRTYGPQQALPPMLKYGTTGGSVSVLIGGWPVKQQQHLISWLATLGELQTFDHNIVETRVGEMRVTLHGVSPQTRTPRKTQNVPNNQP